VPSAGKRPYSYDCALLDMYFPGCDNRSDYLHDKHVEDVILHAKSLGYSANLSVWWGFSAGAAMISQHLNYLLQRNSSDHMPKAMVMEANGGQYCYAFRPEQKPELELSPYWNRSCNNGGGWRWGCNDCCPTNLTEQYYYEHPSQYRTHPAVLTIGGDADKNTDPNGPRFYHETLRDHGARSAMASWAGAAHGITPSAFGFAASFVKDALLSNSTSNSASTFKSDDTAATQPTKPNILHLVADDLRPQLQSCGQTVVPS
jgi:hypothetical protein